MKHLTYVELCIDHPYKEWLYNRIFQHLKIEYRLISDSQKQLVKQTLNKTFNQIMENNQNSEFSPDFKVMFEKLIEVANLEIKNIIFPQKVA